MSTRNKTQPAEQLALAADSQPRESAASPRERQQTSATPAALTSELAARLERSAVWSAYGDALGFISELVDARGLARRIGDSKPLTVPVPWKRRVGGKFGVELGLPAGMYSDDTQLRLATSRAISNGVFDIEVFTKVELPVWLAYSLGGGRTTKQAAAQFIKPGVPWYGNSFTGWTKGGGNGAAMRIQPHVWAGHGADNGGEWLTDVVRNSVTTHGHPVGILGAVLHAAALDDAIRSSDVPSPSTLVAIFERATEVPTLMQQDPELGIWQGLWERAERRPFAAAWLEALVEARSVADSAAHAIRGGNDASTNYQHLLAELRLLEPERRGSGVLTAIAALALTWLDSSASGLMAIAANALGSDTDSIATMAGAILGAVTDEDPPGPLVDEELIRAEVGRLLGLKSKSRAWVQYPDLLTWSAPKSQADALVADGSELHVVGLGRVATTLQEARWANDGEFGWQIVRLETGQTLVIKRRRTLAELRPSDRPSAIVTAERDPSSTLAKVPTTSSPTSYRPIAPHSSSGGRLPSGPHASSVGLPIELAPLIRFLEEARYDDKAVGAALRQVLRRGSPDQLAALLVAVQREVGRSSI